VISHLIYRRYLAANAEIAKAVGYVCYQKQFGEVIGFSGNKKEIRPSESLSMAYGYVN